jgi:hypothetical protein
VGELPEATEAARQGKAMKILLRPEYEPDNGFESRWFSK